MIAGFHATNQHLNISNRFDLILKHNAIILMMTSETLEINNHHATPIIPYCAPIYKQTSVSIAPKKRSSVPNFT